jgi:hypothetical protein
MDQQRRVVVYIGPPKTVSTPLPIMPVQVKGKREKAFEGWNYHLFMGDKNGTRKLHNTSPKTSSNRVCSDWKELRAARLICKLGGGIGISDCLCSNPRRSNVVMPEIVIQSRSPRIDHCISIWKQQTQMRGKEWHGWSFPQYMCSKRSCKIVRHQIDLFADPIGVAHDMVHKYKLPTYVMDMEGISQQGLDVCHAFVMNVNVNCTEGNKWVQGLEGVTVHANSKLRDPKLSSKQKEEIETLFHQRDCADRDELYNHSLFHLLYRHAGLWPKDCTNLEAMPVYRYNDSMMQ